MEYNFTQRYNSPLHRDSEYRGAYEVDRARIIHSEAFRRLQSKTQVLQTTEGDFHRTRLTHSVEVAQIGRSIGKYLQQQHHETLASCQLDVDIDLIETICLAHDIGHPPFGHGGEIALNYMMRNHGGFEGNAQTLRIVSKLGKYSDDGSMDLTRRSLLGLIKYPCNYHTVWNSNLERKVAASFADVDQRSWDVAKCYYDEEQAIFDWLIEPFATDRQLFTSHQINDRQNHCSKYKSFDCSIMDVADDISYVVGDFEDGYMLKLLDREATLREIFAHEYFLSYLQQTKQYTTERINKLRNGTHLKQLYSNIIDFFIKNITIVTVDEKFESPYLRYNAKMNSEADLLLQYLKGVVRTQVIESARNQQLVKQGQIVVCELYEFYYHNQQLLPEATSEKLASASNPERVICDYISGMTDSYAMKMRAALI